MGNSPQTKDWLEGRRLRALELAEAGWKQKAIAEALGVSEGAVSQWMKRAQEGGREALQRHPAPGAVSKLSMEQFAKLPEVLGRGAEAYGYRGNVWTYERVAAVIAQEFGIKYHPDHMNFILKKIGWSRQKPRKRAAQRDEESIQEWQEDWPSVEKKLRRRSRR
jgi:transposase